MEVDGLRIVQVEANPALAANPESAEVRIQLANSGPEPAVMVIDLTMD